MKSAPAAGAAGATVHRPPLSLPATTSQRSAATSAAGAEGPTAGALEVDGRFRAAITSTIAINRSTTIPRTTFIHGRSYSQPGALLRRRERDLRPGVARLVVDRRGPGLPV